GWLARSWRAAWASWRRRSARARRFATSPPRSPGWRRPMVDGPRVAVVGSGFGGLAAAIRLAAAGVRTVLFEARDRPGGRAYVYEDAGYTFDAGPTVITAPETLEELFTIAGERLADHVEMLPVKPFYRLRWSDGTSFDY